MFFPPCPSGQNYIFWLKVNLLKNFRDFVFGLLRKLSFIYHPSYCLLVFNSLPPTFLLPCCKHVVFCYDRWLNRINLNLNKNAERTFPPSLQWTLKCVRVWGELSMVKLLVKAPLKWTDVGEKKSIRLGNKFGSMFLELTAWSNL